MAVPVQYRWGEDAALRKGARDQAELRGRRLKAGPKTHAPVPLAPARAAE